MAEAVPRDYVLARWVYSELPSGRYSGPGVQKLTEKAHTGVPFDELGQAERDLLVRKWQQVRGGASIFHAALDGSTEFELTHWTREQLAAAYVIPMFAGEVGHAHSLSSSGLQLSRMRLLIRVLRDMLQIVRALLPQQRTRQQLASFKS